MALPLDLLEQRLQSLGRKERQLEDLVRELPLGSRAAAIRGDFISADQFSNLLEEVRYPENFIIPMFR